MLIQVRDYYINPDAVEEMHIIHGINQCELFIGFKSGEHLSIFDSNFYVCVLLDDLVAKINGETTEVNA